ncbi:MAG: ATP-binding protein [Bacteroidota bacterium]
MKPQLLFVCMILCFQANALATSVLDSLQRQLDTWVNEEAQEEMLSTQLVLASTYKEQYQFELAEKHALDALSLARSINQPTQQFRALFLLGNVAFWRDQYPLAIERLTLARKIGQEHATLSEQSDNLSLLSQVYLALGKHRQALFHQFQAKEMAELTNDSLLMAKAFNSLGIIYYQGKEYEIGSKYLNESLYLYQQLNQSIHLWSVLATLASGRLEQGLPEAALPYCERALPLAKQIGYQYGIAFSQGTLGMIQLELKESDSARFHLEAALATFDSMGVQAEKAEFLFALSQLDQENGAHKQAIDQLEQILSTALHINSPRIASQAYLALAQNYEALGKGKEALQALKAHQSLQDSLQLEEKQVQLKEAETEFDIHRRQQRKWETQSEQQGIRNRAILITTVVTLSLLIFAGIWMLRAYGRERHKRLRLNQKYHVLWQENHQLMTRHNRLSHLASLGAKTLQSPLLQLRAFLFDRADSPPESQMKELEWVEQWIEDMSLYASVEQAREQMKPLPLADAVSQAIAELPEPLRKQANRISMADLPTVRAHPEQMTLLFRQLIANAIEYRGEAALIISINSRQDGNRYLIEVQDNGRGLPEELTREMVDVSFRKREAASHQPIGIGLAICKAIVELHLGQLWVESQVGQGSSVFFTLPTFQGE